MTYEKQTWENYPSTASPLNADRLNHMEDGIEAAGVSVAWHSYASTNRLMTPSYGFGGSTLNANYAYALPVLVERSITVDRIGVNVGIGGGAGSVVRLGIYDDTATGGGPGALIVDGGTVDTTGTGIKEVSVSQALVPGVYWLVAAAQVGTSPQVTDLRGVGIRNHLMTGSNPIMNGSYPIPGFITASGSVSGALPANFPAFGAAGNPWRIWVRIA